MANHGSFHVSVPQEFLDGADIVAAFEQLRCEGMSERVACRVFWNPGLSGRLFHGLLDGFVEMMPPPLTPEGESQKEEEAAPRLSADRIEVDIDVTTSVVDAPPPVRGPAKGWVGIISPCLGERLPMSWTRQGSSACAAITRS